jgi:hypothetical protein
MLMTYISAKSYPKMLRKLLDEKHSRTFYEYLRRACVKDNPEAFPAADGVMPSIDLR